MNLQPIRRKLIVVVGTLATVYVIVLLAVFLFQRRLLYFPSRAPLAELTQRARSVSLDPWTNAAGQTIGWVRRAPRSPSAGLVLVVHGNGGHAVHRAAYADALQRAANVEVRILEYPGYGARDGESTERSLCAAADEAMAVLGESNRVYVVGESLGTGVACYLAGAYTNRVAGVLLVAPYDRLFRVAQSHYPFLPAGLIMHDRFDSADRLQNYSGPLYVWLGGSDIVVPTQFGRSLYDGYHGPKRLHETPGAGHEDVWKEPGEWWKEAAGFLGIKPD